MSLPKMTVATVFLSTLWFAAALPAQTAETNTTSDGASKVRIVRLSDVKGDVQMDRAIGRGMEPAIANLPVVEQTRIQTAMGAAEVEFEDNSSLRVAPNSIVEFPKLERLPSGATVSSVRVLKGTAYVSLMKSSAGNQFSMLFGQQNVSLSPGSHVRLEMDSADAKLAVLDGALKLQGTSGEVDVAKKKTVTFNLATAGELSVNNHVESEPLDSWDKDSVGYHSRVATVSAMNNSPYTYGVSDLMYYGSFMDAGSCGMGMMWRPYFASAAWDPYASGSWAWYGNSGYSWVSPYPWGWTPYHSGSWNFCPGMGWGWTPGGNWMGLNNISMVPLQNAPRTGSGGGTVRPVMPTRPPAKGGPSLIPVNTRGLVRSGLNSADSFEFRRDSAGLGVPRQTLGKLDKFSHEAMTRGTASTQIYVNVPNANNGRMSGRAGSPNSAMMGATIHRGAPASNGPQSSYGSMPAGGGRGPGASAPSSSSMPPTSSRGPSSAPAGGGRPH